MALHGGRRRFYGEFAVCAVLCSARAGDLCVAQKRRLLAGQEEEDDVRRAGEMALVGSKPWVGAWREG